jgi:hypothetical protein
MCFCEEQQLQTPMLSVALALFVFLEECADTQLPSRNKSVGL